MFKMSSAGCNAGCQSLAPFTDHVVNHFLVQTVPFLTDTLAQLFHVHGPVMVILQECVYNHHRITAVEELRQRAEEEWDRLDQEVIDNAISEWHK